MVYLHRARIPITHNWFAIRANAPVFFALVVGGYIGGGLLGVAGFSDWRLIGLYKSHLEDKAHLVHGQSVSNYQVE